MKGNNTIPIAGELESKATGGVVVSAEGVYDYTKGKSQEAVNEELAQGDEVLKALYRALKQSNVVVIDANTDLPTTGELDTIYRKAGSTNYTDYMYDGTTMVPMATYNNAIDDVVSDSSNLVSNKAVNNKFGEVSAVIGNGLGFNDPTHFTYGAYYREGNVKEFKTVEDANNPGYVTYSQVTNWKTYCVDVPSGAVSLTFKTVGYTSESNYIYLTDDSDKILAVGKRTVTSAENRHYVTLRMPVVSGAKKAYLNVYGNALDDWRYTSLTFGRNKDSVDIFNSYVEEDTGVVRSKTSLEYTRSVNILRTKYSDGTPTKGWTASELRVSAIVDVSELVGRKVHLNYSEYSNGPAIAFCKDSLANIPSYSTDAPSDSNAWWAANMIEPTESSVLTVPEGALWMIVNYSYTKLPDIYVLESETKVALEGEYDDDISSIINSIGVERVLPYQSIRANNKSIRFVDNKDFSDGFWYASGIGKPVYAYFPSYIYNLTGFEPGTPIEISCCKRANYHHLCFLRSLDLETATGSDKTKWAAAYIPNEQDTFDSDSDASLSTYATTIPEGAVYLVCLGYKTVNGQTTIEPVVTVKANKDSIMGRLDALEGGGEGDASKEKKWVTDERERIEGLLDGLLGHQLVIWGFNTDQHVDSGNTDAVKRGLQALVRMAESYNFDLIVLGGDDSDAGNDTQGFAAAKLIEEDIKTVNGACDTTVCPVVNLVGNHDASHVAGDNMSDADEKTFHRYSFNNNTTYRLKTQKNVARKQVVWSVPTGGNFIIDDDIKKCRYIFFDGWSKKYESSTDTVYTDGYRGANDWVCWFEETLRVALDDEKLYNGAYKVYIFSHNVSAPASNEDTSNKLAPVFNNRKSVWNSLIEGAQSHGIDIVVGVNGHNHTVSMRNNHGILFTSTASAGLANDSANGFENRRYTHKNNSSTETLFDVYVHDITDQRLYALAYGAPSDRIWDLSGSEPELLLDNLTVVFDTQQSLVGATATASYHNTVFEVTADASGHFNFPYLTPERVWLINIQLSGSEESVENYEYTAVAGTHTLEL